MALVEMDFMSGMGDKNCKFGFIPYSELTGNDCTVTGLGFKPKYICWFSRSSYNYNCVYYYNENVSTTKFSGLQYTVTVNDYVRVQ